MKTACELCQGHGGELLWTDDRCRVLRVGGPEATAFPGYCRVVWNAHVAEMTDLTTAEASHLYRVIGAVETAVRAVARPDKINLASLGNVVPHLHWHVIPRWQDDSHFPRPIWAEPMRPQAPRAALADEALRAAVMDRCTALAGVAA